MGDTLRRFIAEAVRITRLEDDQQEAPETGLEAGTDLEPNQDDDQGLDALTQDENDPNQPDQQPEEPQDPNRAGLIRRVPGAHLVFKREAEDGTYEELWVYNVRPQMRDELKVRREILAGTDIPVNRTESEDGSQTYEIWTAGNAQLVHIKGLPN